MKDYQGKRKDQVESSNKLFIICIAAGIVLAIIAGIIEILKIIL